jgi:hypothetical protein
MGALVTTAEDALNMVVVPTEFVAATPRRRYFPILAKPAANDES